MKTWTTLFVIASAFASGSVFADPEVFNIGAGFMLEKCIPDSSGNLTCSEVPGSVDMHNQAITLSQCQPDGNGGNECTGSWPVTVTVDGYTFQGNLQVSHEVNSSGNSSYEVSAASTNSTEHEMNYAISILAKPSATDLVIDLGNMVNVSATSTTYFPMLIFGPAGYDVKSAVRARIQQLHLK